MRNNILEGDFFIYIFAIHYSPAVPRRLDNKVLFNSLFIYISIDYIFISISTFTPASAMTDKISLEKH